MHMINDTPSARGRRGRTLAVSAVLALGAAAAAPSLNAQTVRGGPAPGSFLPGIQDDRAIQVEPQKRFRMMAEAGARIARIDLRWDFVAKSRPGNAANDKDPAYDWTIYDGVVQAARKNRMQIVFTVWGTPEWAVNRSLIQHGDLNYGIHTFPPLNADDFGRFGQALARRYGKLGVKKWEGWNEPNVPIFLQPQFLKRGNTHVPYSPRIYAPLQRAFYRGIKSVDRRAQVAGVVTSPAGNVIKPGQTPARVIPTTFVRMLNSPGLRPPMDFVAHHPYPTRQRTDRPTRPGRAYADLYNLDEFTRTVDRTYLRGKRLWLTEYGFSTSKVPEYDTIVSPAGQANNINDAFVRIKKNRRVAMGVYYFLQDHPGWRSGLYMMNLRKKVGHDAHALPLWPRTTGRTSVLWGQARTAIGRTTVRVQTRTGGAWRTTRVIRTAADGSFNVTVNSARRVQVRVHWKGKTRAGTNVVRMSRPVTVGGR